MQLPFSHEAFLNVFGEYNARPWPVAAVLWLATAVTAWQWLTRTIHDARNRRARFVADTVGAGRSGRTKHAAEASTPRGVWGPRALGRLTLSRSRVFPVCGTGVRGESGAVIHTGHE